MAKPIPVTDYKNLKKLRTNVHQDRRLANSNLRPVFGFDTETYQGNIFLIADSEGRFLDEITAESCLKWLFSTRYQGSWNFFYNISYDAEVILKLLGEDILNTYRRTRKLEFHYNGYTIEYIPNKKLSIRKGHHSTVFYDIAQYYHASLANAYQDNIEELPEEYLEIKKKRSEFSPRLYSRNKRKVRQYCIDDCIYTKKLAEHWIKLFFDAFLFYPARWLSSGYLAEKTLLNNGIDIPKFDCAPYEIQDLAFRSYVGGRTEILKRGFIGEAYSYDLNSAYPYALSQIPDITKGQWVNDTAIQKDAKLGFFRIRANISDSKHIAPFSFRTNHTIVYPTGEFETFGTLAELLIADPNEYTILEAFQFIPDKVQYPFADFINSMYKKRLQLKQNNNPLQLPIKIILNSIYGKTGQAVNGRIGNLFNPILFSSITGITRAKLYDFVIQNNLEKNCVYLATDSVCTTRNLGINSDVLGQFSLEKSGYDVFVLQNGINRFGGKWKQRGLGKLGSKTLDNFETYQRDGKLFTRFKVMRSGRLRASILQNSYEDIGKIKVIEREVDLNADRKRLWFGQISSVDSRIMNESKPLSMNYFEKNQI